MLRVDFCRLHFSFDGFRYFFKRTHALPHSLQLFRKCADHRGHRDAIRVERVQIKAHAEVHRQESHRGGRRGSRSHRRHRTQQAESVAQQSHVARQHQHYQRGNGQEPEFGHAKKKYDVVASDVWSICRIHEDVNSRWFVCSRLFVCCHSFQCSALTSCDALRNVCLVFFASFVQQLPSVRVSISLQRITGFY